MLKKDIRGKIYSYAVKSLGLRDYRRGWLKGNCPSCGRVDKFGFNIPLNRTNCFICGYNPSPTRLIMDIENFTEYRELWAFLNIYEGRAYLEPVIERIERIDAVLPEGFRSLIIGDSRISRTARSYVKSRGFDPEEMSYKGWGYGTAGSYYGYLVIPFYIGGKLIYYNARRFMGSGPKYNNPKIDEFGLGKSLILYNMDALALYDTIYLAEGAINAETIGSQGIATGGKKISNYQISMILKSDVKRVVILLDPDALDDAFKIGLEMAYHKKIKVIMLPEGKDINDLGKETTLDLVSQTKWMRYNELLKYYHEIK